MGGQDNYRVQPYPMAGAISGFAGSVSYTKRVMEIKMVGFEKFYGARIGPGCINVLSVFTDNLASLVSHLTLGSQCFHPISLFMDLVISHFLDLHFL